MCSISSTIALPVSGSSEYLTSRDSGNDLGLAVREKKSGQAANGAAVLPEKAAVVEKPKVAAAAQKPIVAAAADKPNLAAAGSNQHKGANAASGQQKNSNANAAGAAGPAAKPQFKKHKFEDFQYKGNEDQVD
ncbi:hypothetical protein CVT24_009273 [Panaeolus cyanescens]|uniref:Uncharacterized protein n=1 Tax=Panaeolus cyanescens TaxID=181874 RepID=A0A409Y8E1_9AGAR|nr:hypothetical protein CVT24_009273 [Panaeolus cyanescens]